MDDKDNCLFGVAAEIARTPKPPSRVDGSKRRSPERVYEFGHQKSRQHALHSQGGLHARLRNARIQPVLQIPTASKLLIDGGEALRGRTAD
jgi:hypothetical protein